MYVYATAVCVLLVSSKGVKVCVCVEGSSAWPMFGGGKKKRAWHGRLREQPLHAKIYDLVTALIDRRHIILLDIVIHWAPG